MGNKSKRNGKKGRWKPRQGPQGGFRLVPKSVDTRYATRDSGGGIRLFPCTQPVPIPKSECNQLPQPWQKRAERLAD